MLDGFRGGLESPRSIPFFPVSLYPKRVLENDIHALSVTPSNIILYRGHLAKNTALALDYCHLLIVPSPHGYLSRENELNKLLKKFFPLDNIVRQ
jgi:hypothetical protein